MIQCHHAVRRVGFNVLNQWDRGGSALCSQGVCGLSSITSSLNEWRLFSTMIFKGNAKVDETSNYVPGTKLLQPFREYAARKGTRARKAAKKVKKVEVKQPFVFKQLQKLAALPYKNLRPKDDSDMPIPVDDVYFVRKFRSQAYDFDEVVNFFREIHHPTVFNVPNAPLYLRVNLDMKYPHRATKCMDGWRSVIEMKKPFLLEGMTTPSVLAFCIEDVDYIENVKKEGGADLAGGKELIKAIQAGDVNSEEFEYLVAHPAVVPELTVIRGLIKKKFPTIKTRTISVDLVPEIRRLKSGIKVQAIKNDREPDFAYIETPIGTIDMDGLRENFRSIVEDTVRRRVTGKLPQDFIISCVLKTPGNSLDEFKVDISDILLEMETAKKNKSESSSVAETEDDIQNDTVELHKNAAI